MQHSDERPQSSARPSLLSSEQQAEADRQRILSGLDGKPEGAGAAAEQARRAKLTWLAAGAALVAIVAGSAVWLSGEDEIEIVRAGMAPLPSAAAPAVALASEPPMVAEAEVVSSAIIVDDAPAIAAKSDDKAADEAMSKLLAPKAAAPVPVAAKAAPKKRVAVAKAAPVNPVAKRRAHTAMAKNFAPTLKKKPVVHPKAVVQTDSDVALLAALVAHSKATQPKHPVGIAGKLQQCKTLGSVAQAEQCRARLCVGGAKSEAECKAPSLAKTRSSNT